MATEDQVDIEIGARIRALRLARKVSLEGLGARIGVTYQQVQKYEKGANRVSASTLLKIGEALGVPAAHLLGEDMPAGFPEDVRPLFDGISQLPADIRQNLVSGMTNMVASFGARIA